MSNKFSGNANIKYKCKNIKSKQHILTPQLGEENNKFQANLD